MDKLNVIGRCKLVDIELIKLKIPDILKEEQENTKYWQHIYSLWENNQRSEEFKKVNFAYDNTFFRHSKDNIDKFFNRLHKWMIEVDYNDLVIKCYYRDDIISIIGYSNESESWFVLPSEFVTVHTYKNYDYLTGSERKHLFTGKDLSSNVDSNIIEVNETSKNDLVTKQSEAQTKMKVLEQEIQDVKDAKTEELAKLQAEIDAKMAELEAKKADMMAVLEQKKSEMELALEKMNFEIFKLDSEIYAIRCYTGEVLELKKIISGKCATSDTPMIFHQKMRYLDEELGKLISLYNVDYSDSDTFEKLLKSRSDIVEYFAPTERSIMLVRVSKSNTYFGHDYEKYENALTAYRKYHGDKVAIIIRDGENLYIAWTDDERIYFSEDAFYKPGEIEISERDIAILQKDRWESEESYQKRIRSEKMNELRTRLGRYYVFTLLQGIFDRGIIQFPEKVNIQSNSKYIVWSYADGWITTDEYGSFSDMIDKCNKSIKVGDKILTVDSIRPSRRTGFWGGSTDQAFHNDRGIGHANRTHDVQCQNNTIYPVNLIVHSAKYKYKIFHKSTPNDIEENTAVWTDEEYKQVLSGDYRPTYTYTEIEKLEGTDEYQHYISLEKNENWFTGKSARANFEIYKDECINLTFMNSVWLKYVLVNHKADNIKIHGENVDFAHMIKYINKAITHVKEREEQVAEWIKNIDSTILDDDKWVVKLSEWMLEKDIHNFSEFRAKQFTKAIGKR